MVIPRKIPKLNRAVGRGSDSPSPTIGGNSPAASYRQRLEHSGIEYRGCQKRLLNEGHEHPRRVPDLIA
jgi:hypothetical protein